MLYIFEKIVGSFIFSKGCGRDKKTFKKKESIVILKIIGSVNNIEEYQKNITEKNVTQELRLK